MLDDYFRQYGLLAIFLFMAVSVGAGMLMASAAFGWLGIRPSRPDPVKRSIYESGMRTLWGEWSGFNFRFYTFALIFVIFDVEVVFLFPWAAAYGFLSARFGLFILIEMVIFVGMLVLAWAYAWRKGALEWR